MRERLLTSFCVVFAAALAGMPARVAGDEIHEAARSGDTARVEELLAESPELLYTETEVGAPPLHWAAFGGNPETAELLIDQGAEIDARMENGFTPLHCAVFKGHPEVVQLLLDRGADADARTDAGFSGLLIAVRKDARDIAALLVAAGADVNAKGGDGVSPLDWATEKNAVEMIRILKNEPEPQPEPEPKLRAVTSRRLRRWRISAERSYFSGAVSFDNAGSYSASVDLLDLLSPGHSRRANVGSPDSYSDREYDNGYVRIDPGTSIFGDTWYWGYDRSSQVSGDYLVFSAYNGTYVGSADGDAQISPVWEDDSVSDSGFSVRADFVLGRLWRLNCGVLAGMSQGSFSASSSAEQEWILYDQYVIDQYDISAFKVPPLFGPWIPFPSAPYRGTYDGPGPLIANIPSVRRTTTSEIPGVHAEISESLKVDFTTIILGGFAELEMDLAPLARGGSGKPGRYALYLAVAGGPAARRVELEAARSETLYGASGGSGSSVLEAWSDSDSREEWQRGYFVRTDAGIQAFDRLRVGAFGCYEWLDDISGNVGPSAYAAEISEFSYGAMLSWSM